MPRWFAYNMFEWSDDVTLMRGNHTLKTGLLVKRIRHNYEQTNAAAGFYSFTGGLITFLQGQPNRFLAQVPGTSPHRNFRQTFLGFYVQDDFKVRPNLTLNLGVREEFLTSPNEVHGKCSSLPDVMLTEPIVGCPLFETFKLNLMPRVGFAWDTMGNGKLAVRGGFGLFYDQPFPTYWLFSGHGSPPFYKLGQIDNPRLFPNDYTLLESAALNLGDIRPTTYTGAGYSMQYNFTIQTEILPGTAVTLGYVGSQQRHVFRTGQMNTGIPAILPDGRQFFNRNDPRRNPRLGDVRIQQTDANGNYNALVASVVKRFGSGLQIQGSYTFSKIMSMSDSVRGADFSSGEHQVMDPYNPRLDRAPSAYSEKHNFSSNFTYDLPVRVSGAAGQVLSGWGITGIARISSGAPLSVLSQFGSDNGSSGSVIQERPNLAPGMATTIR